MSSDITRIELAKALKTLKAISTDAQFEKAKEIFIQTDGEESVMSAVKGLSEEDEFAMLTKLMGTATHIVGLEQRPIIEGDYVVPDFFVNLKFGCLIKKKSSKEFTGLKCLIEVKSTEKDVFKIGGNKLRRLRNFADLMGFPLFFAIRFLRAKQNAIWAIIVDQNRAETSLNVTYQDVVDGVRKVIWNEYVLTLNPKLIVICEFSKSSNINSITHHEYGKQISATYTIGSNSITHKDSKAFMTCGLLEAYDLEEINVEKVNTDITRQYLKPKLFTAFLADIIYKMNNLIIDEFGNVIYDASKLLVRSDTGAHNTLINRTIIETLVKPLLDENLLFLGGIGQIEDHYNRWIEFGGKK